jgi:hypothetical protein
MLLSKNLQMLHHRFLPFDVQGATPLDVACMARGKERAIEGV